VGEKEKVRIQLFGCQEKNDGKDFPLPEKPDTLEGKSIGGEGRAVCTTGLKGGSKIYGAAANLRRGYRTS